MKTLLKSILSLLFLLNLSCNSTEKSKNVQSDIVSKTTNTQVNEFAIVIHGGAGTILKKNMTRHNKTKKCSTAIPSQAIFTYLLKPATKGKKQRKISTIHSPAKRIQS